MKTILPKKCQSGGAGTIILITCGIFALLGLALAARLILYPAEQGVRIYEKTLDADNVIYNYEYFKKQHQEIRAMDVKIVNAETELSNFLTNAGPRSSWDFRDKEELARLSANVTGVKNVRQDMVADYNAKSRMINRSIFKGKDVPAEIAQ